MKTISTLIIAVLFFAAPLYAAPEPAKKNIVFPIVFSTPETGAAFGVSDILVFHGNGSADRPSDIVSAVYYTQKDQWVVNLIPTLRTPSWIIGGGLFLMKFPDRLFGMGTTIGDDKGELYTLRNTGAQVFALRRYGRFSAGFVGEYKLQDISDIESSGLLASHAVEGYAGGTVAGLGAGARYDSRDSIYYPSRGANCELFAFSYGPALGSDYAFGKVVSDNRLYRRFSSAGIAAFQCRIEATSGDVPFKEAPALGGSNLLRGYYQGRYRDKALCALQAEYRHTFSPRFHGVLFAGAGQTMSRLADIAADRVKAAWGFGARYSLDKVERINIRLDIASGEGSSGGVYFMLLESF
jgi:hypothetical protein